MTSEYATLLVAERQLDYTRKCIARAATIDPAHHPTETEKELLGYMTELVENAKFELYQAERRRYEMEQRILRGR